MKNITVAILLLLSGGLLVKGSGFVVVDAENKSPVVAAAVFSGSGKIIGITDAAGKTGDIQVEDYPLMIKSLGYQSVEFSSHCDTIALPRSMCELGEVVISPHDRPVLRTVCYVR